MPPRAEAVEAAVMELEAEEEEDKEEGLALNP